MNEFGIVLCQDRSGTRLLWLQGLPDILSARPTERRSRSGGEEGGSCDARLRRAKLRRSILPTLITCVIVMRCSSAKQERQRTPQSMSPGLFVVQCLFREKELEAFTGLESTLLKESSERLVTLNQ